MAVMRSASHVVVAYVAAAVAPVAAPLATAVQPQPAEAATLPQCAVPAGYAAQPVRRLCIAYAKHATYCRCRRVGLATRYTCKPSLMSAWLCPVKKRTGLQRARRAAATGCVSVVRPPGRRLECMYVHACRHEHVRLLHALPCCTMRPWKRCHGGAESSATHIQTMPPLRCSRLTHTCTQATSRAAASLPAAGGTGGTCCAEHRHTQLQRQSGAAWGRGHTRGLASG